MQKHEISVNPKDGAEMVYIPPGEFLMGTDQEELDRIWTRFGWPETWKQKDESPAHRVRLTKGFWLYRTTVTNAMYRKFVAETGHRKPEGYGLDPAGKKDVDGVKFWEDSRFNGPQQPVVGVSWNDAVAYSEWSLGQGVGRLPTEAEWEYAGRGGETGVNGRPRHAFVWGDELPRSGDRVGNLADESVKRALPVLGKNWSIFEVYDDGYPYTAPVGQFEANGYGLYDMAGNVWQWCGDWYAEDYYGKLGPLAVDAENSTTAQSRVLRGGSADFNPSYLRASSRHCLGPEGRYNFLGFRPARTE